ncbi:hypothetical protein FVE85_1769 [Porphyridium purpureum]|uniref:PB1 domain-containing protein n=1 Tax=Porphyridium purpureum TaxID=35688 RepID=A0A5J4YY34_PORPP|nr:hypothetical protein FVE85_1769 [Porphyridium purpureum]|eukprot:POR1064..scf209_3
MDQKPGQHFDVKISYKGELRRVDFWCAFKIDGSSDDVIGLSTSNFNGLKTLVPKLFGTNQYGTGPGDGPKKFMYEDDDGDMISVSSETEMSKALSLGWLRSSGYRLPRLKFFVYDTNEEQIPRVTQGLENPLSGIAGSPPIRSPWKTSSSQSMTQSGLSRDLLTGASDRADGTRLTLQVVEQRRLREDMLSSVAFPTKVDILTPPTSAGNTNESFDGATEGPSEKISRLVSRRQQMADRMAHESLSRLFCRPTEPQDVLDVAAALRQIQRQGIPHQVRGACSLQDTTRADQSSKSKHGSIMPAPSQPEGAQIRSKRQRSESSSYSRARPTMSSDGQHKIVDTISVQPCLVTGRASRGEAQADPVAGRDGHKLLISRRELALRRETRITAFSSAALATGSKMRLLQQLVAAPVEDEPNTIQQRNGHSYIAALRESAALNLLTFDSPSSTAQSPAGDDQRRKSGQPSTKHQTN